MIFSEEHIRQQAVVDSLASVVETNLKFLAPLETRWWPAKFFLFLEGSPEEMYAGMREQRRQAEGLSDELLVVLVGNAITEDALANYALRLGVPTSGIDRIGVSDNPWMKWARGWLAEEHLHGIALTRYLLLTGRVDMQAVDRTTTTLIQNGFEQDPSPYVGLFYPTFQEKATNIAHDRVGIMARNAGAIALADICTKIKADEHRHGLVYLHIAQALFETDEDHAMIEFGRLMQEGLKMPSQRMTDTEHPKPPVLYGRFARVSTRIGVYTPEDYAGILTHLNTELGIAGRSV